MQRKAFTLVEGQSPVGFYKDRIDTEELVSKIVRHEQATLCLEQVGFFVFPDQIALYGRDGQCGHSCQIYNFAM